jgi:hypothetical protein
VKTDVIDGKKMWTLYVSCDERFRNNDIPIKRFDEKPSKEQIKDCMSIVLGAIRFTKGIICDQMNDIDAMSFEMKASK